MLISCAALGITFFSTTHSAHAASCDAYRPCAQTPVASNGSITVSWFYGGADGNVPPTGIDGYNILWSANGGSRTQSHIDTHDASSSFTINNVDPDAYYGFSIEACQTHFLGSSSCTAWSDIVYYAPYGLDTCLGGYVWRQAYDSSDHVCVTPETRDQAAYDNSQAASRVDPNGAYGPDTCINGYVWREADQGIAFSVSDHVCVTPETRDQAAYDNSQDASRKLFH